ncbi:SDR family NAD(P)-dependent oxidoreductase [Actinomadura sp. SCN-SB]|uniref:SDR family NAD(P)-dependent oxidoreductase n=1 Tax=Actinomadura sp. SCN-SB TaxID=3373092 RepID=UPI0037537259
MGRLTGRCVIVTGGGHGIGRAYCHRLAAEGAAVTIAELDAAAAEAVCEEIGDAGGTALAVPTDVADEDGVGRMVERSLAEFGRIDGLVNNAAIFATVPMSRVGIGELSVEEWDRMMAVNLRGTFLTCRAVLPAMRRQGSGRIVNISSGTALSGSPSRLHYVTSKAGVLGFTRSLAREVGPYGITVNAVAPGSTLSEKEPDERVLELRRRRVGARALARVQMPGDVVGAVVFFLSEDGAFVTGQTLVVDGGATMH